MIQDQSVNVELRTCMYENGFCQVFFFAKHTHANSRGLIDSTLLQ